MKLPLKVHCTNVPSAGVMWYVQDADDAFLAVLEEDECRAIVAAVNHAEALAAMLHRARNVLRIVQPDDDALDDIDAVLAAYDDAKEAQP